MYAHIFSKYFHISTLFGIYLYTDTHALSKIVIYLRRVKELLIGCCTVCIYMCVFYLNR